MDPAALKPPPGVDIIGATSDHLVLDATETNLDVGDEVAFTTGYSALLRAMTSPYVAKTYVHEPALSEEEDRGAPFSQRHRPASR